MPGTCRRWFNARSRCVLPLPAGPHRYTGAAASARRAAVSACQRARTAFGPGRKLSKVGSATGPMARGSCRIATQRARPVARAMRACHADSCARMRVGIVGVGPVLQVERQVVNGVFQVAQFALHQGEVTALVPGLRQQRSPAAAARPPGAAGRRQRAVDFLQVAQQPRHDVARLGGLQVQAQRHFVVAGQAETAPEGHEPVFELVARQRLAAEGVEDDLAPRHAQLHQEMPGEGHALGLQAHLGGDLDVQHRQRDGDAAACLQHLVQVAVAPVVVVVDVAGEAQFMEEVGVQKAQALQCAGVAGQAPAQALGEHVDLGQHAWVSSRGSSSWPTATAASVSGSVASSATSAAKYSSAVGVSKLQVSGHGGQCRSAAAHELPRAQAQLAPARRSRAAPRRPAPAATAPTRVAQAACRPTQSIALRRPGQRGAQRRGSPPAPAARTSRQPGRGRYTPRRSSPPSSRPALSERAQTDRQRQPGVPEPGHQHQRSAPAWPAARPPRSSPACGCPGGHRTPVPAP